MQHLRNDATLTQCVTKLLAGPCFPQYEFVRSGATFAHLHTMSAELQTSFRHVPRDRPVCLCANDKATVAAALLASLAGGPTLVVPYAFSKQALSELHALTGYPLAVTDASRPVPEGVQSIMPEGGHVSRAIGKSTPKSLDEDWVHLFTGGSTGKPKLWTKSVRNLISETLSIVSTFAITEQDHLVATVDSNHIYGLLYAVLTPLLASAKVTATTPSFPNEIIRAVNDADASILISVPAHYRALNGLTMHAPNLRLALSSAGMLAEVDANAFETQTGVGVTEIYGSTETGGIASRMRARGESDFKPLKSVQVRVADEHLQVKSDYLSPGLSLEDNGFFQMGDRVAPTQGGRFMLLGRADGVIKVGGRRVDLEAVREAIIAYPGIRDALVIALPVGAGRENQIAAIIEGEVSMDGLNRYFAKHLEAHARPRRIKTVQSMPVTSAGKYDRKAIVRLFASEPHKKMDGQMYTEM
ncbi:MAG: acyl--CoA ligase [Desulfatitalea sp.]|nr:acyl--CoA ligase [Desulfatitalea sp.]NNJ99437.1 acyl--CoA ligase [Desulfatitalea sp.]